jgi:hypothetical protein
MEAATVHYSNGDELPLRVKGGGLARSSHRLQCPQLPPIAAIRLIPNDRRLVPKAAVSNRSKTVFDTSSAPAISQNEIYGSRGITPV